MSNEGEAARKVLISSTNLDLEAYRKEAGLACHAADWLADLQENWTEENHPPLDACLKRVREADALVVIVAHRYGWMPEDEKRNPDGKSITWLECEEAERCGKDILAFVTDDDADWSVDLREAADFQHAAEMEDTAAAAKLVQAALAANPKAQSL